MILYNDNTTAELVLTKHQIDILRQHINRPSDNVKVISLSLSHLSKIFQNKN